MAGTEDLQAVVNELRDLEAIKRLKATYCHCVDAGRWEQLSELFTEDAVCDYGFFGVYSGREQIVNKFFRDLVGSATSFNAHMIHNPIIDVHGENASGTWYLTAQTTMQPANQAVWVMGIYRDEFRRVAGEWKISSLKFEFKYYTPFEEGWAKMRMWDPTQ